ncbi:DUF4091 domain-containing protein [Aestuariivivens sediminis]|uniref:DUF4091 domain-containing protein n=1 Tax=Aestuariivivens sediminis TaxID=2913557 RepID=UPI001F57904B|nr:DUF4091 domain-containing protein [Aestuariivivens sediminis]
MKSVVLFFLLLVVNGSFAQLWLVDPLQAIYPDVNDLSHFRPKLKQDVVIGGLADVHLLLKIPIGETFTVTASKNGEELEGVWSELIDVPVEQNTGIDSRTEQYLNKTNPFVIRRAPFQIFEVISPLSHRVLTSKSTFSALRLSIPPSMISEKGIHKIDIQVRSKSVQGNALFKIKVHPVVLPTLAKSQFFYTNWFNLYQMEKQHDLIRWSEPWFTMLRKYAKLMAHGRQNSITIPHELLKYDHGNFVIEDAKMKRYIHIFKSEGFKYFEAPHLMYRGDNDDWSDPELKVILTKKGYYSENGKNDIEAIISVIYDFVKSNHLEKNWLQHIADEPTSNNAACYKDVAEQIKSLFPEVRIMEATNDRDGLVGAIDIWCPLINDFQDNESFFREREKQNEKVLVYTCLIPGGQWLNRTLDMERLRQVYFGWGAAFYNTGGYLHWGLNQYQSDPFTQSVVHHPSPAATANNFLPAGDTHIIYPGTNGPLSSIRFESHRMGCEDYDLLQLLKQKQSHNYDKIIKKLFKSYTDYNLSIADYRRTKKKLINSIK